MMLSDLTRLQELRSILARLRELESRIEARIGELEEAKRLLESGVARRVYRVFADRLLVEVSIEEARRMIEEEMEALRARLEGVRREIKRVEDEVRRLESRLY